MLIKCLTPGCNQFAALADVLCPECRRQSNNCLSSVAVWPVYDAVHPDETLADDLAVIAGFLTAQAQADAELLAHHETVIRRQQRKLDLRRRIVRRFAAERDNARMTADAERARADGLEDQVIGLRLQVAALAAELDQIRDLAAGNGHRPPGLAVVDTAPGDYRPEYAGYNVLYARIDPITGRELLWRWYRAESGG